MAILYSRNDLLNIFNNARFSISHYVHGYYPCSDRQLVASPFNRMFFPLKNPDIKDNYIEDANYKHLLYPGKMYFVPAFFPVKFSLNRELYFLSIHMNMDIFPNVELFSDCSHIEEIDSPPELDSLMQFFNNPPENSYCDALKMGSMIFSMTVKLFDRYKAENFSAPLALKKFSHLADFLNQNGNAKTSVSDLAEICGLSRENFTRNFTAITGFTPKKLIDRFVIKRCVMLLNKGASFKEISYQLKFSNEFVFSRYFKRMTGESPKNWRNKHT